MVIQSNMSPKAIVEIWEITRGIFKKYEIPLVDDSLRELTNKDVLSLLLSELNETVGSSSNTCIEGG